MQTMQPIVTRDEIAAYAREGFVRCSLELASRYDALRVLSLTSPRRTCPDGSEATDACYGVHFFVERRALLGQGATRFEELWCVSWRELLVAGGPDRPGGRALRVRRGSSAWSASPWQLVEPFADLVCRVYDERHAVPDARAVLAIFATKYDRCDPVYARHATRLLIEARAAPLLVELGLPASLEELGQLFDPRQRSQEIREHALVRHALRRDDRALACFCAFASVASGEPLFKSDELCDDDTRARFHALRTAIARIGRALDGLRP
jgi:hypothetical protein